MDPLTLVIIGAVAVYLLKTSTNASSTLSAGQSSSSNALGAGLQAIAKALTSSSSSGGSKGSSGGGSTGSGGSSRSSAGQGAGDATGSNYNPAVDTFNNNLTNIGNDDHQLTYNTPGSTDVLSPDESTDSSDLGNMFASTDSIETAIQNGDSSFGAADGGNGGGSNYQDDNYLGGYDDGGGEDDED